jgi:hypothetical protein
MLAQKLGRVPFVPAKILARHKVLETSDDRFRAAARLRQALLREERGWPMGHYRGPKGSRRKIGNYVAPSAADAAAFVSPEIARLVHLEIAYREDGALADQSRLWCNMLSSAPLVYNLLGALKLDLGLATRVMRGLCPDLVHRVTEILFEHSPARANPNYTDDRTAFDALIKCVTRDRRHGFIAVEVKFSETMTEPAARIRPRYLELAKQSGLYIDPENPALLHNPLHQLTRQNFLAYAAIENGHYSVGRFIVIAPALNSSVQQATALYRQQLVPDSRTVSFDAITLESVIAVLKRAGARKLAGQLYERYCDYSALDPLL